jgi:hypothetical protein
MAQAGLDIPNLTSSEDEEIILMLHSIGTLIQVPVAAAVIAALVIGLI